LSIKKWPGWERVSFRTRRGTSKEASDYCKKDGLFYEFGELSNGGRPGSRTDLAEFKQAIVDGKTDLELIDLDMNTFNRYMKTVDRYRSMIPPKRTEELKVALFVGKPGTGKTREAYNQFPDIYAFPIGKDLWSDGYRGQKEVLIDDFSGGMRLVDLLRFLDRYPIQIPKKGGFNWWCPTSIIITTNVHPRDWYSYKERTDSALALRRRIHIIFDFDNLDESGQVGQIQTEDYWCI